MDKKLDFDDVLIVPRPSSVSSRKDVILVREFTFLNYPKVSWTGVPIIAANMKNIGTIEVAEVLKQHLMLVALNKGCPSTPDLIHTTFNTYGLEETMVYTPLICLDVANGYMEKFVRQVMQVREYYPHAIIMAGNVVTREGTRNLCEAGADIIKVGLGSGAACTTRMKTGVGYPQISAVMECSEVAQEYGVYICSDGGHRTPGDIAKSFAAGADFVMLGNMFAGTDETCEDEKKTLHIAPGRPEYFVKLPILRGNAYKVDTTYQTSEGAAILVERKGSLDDVVKDILGGLRSACAYVGAHNLTEFQEKAQLVRVR